MSIKCTTLFQKFAFICLLVISGYVSGNELEKMARDGNPNAQYEFDLNAKKQTIQIVKPDLIEDFVEVYNQILNKGKVTLVATSASDINM